MRLTFRLADGVFETRSGNHLIVKFDLTSITNKVLSQDSRLYIESIDLGDMDAGIVPEDVYMDIRSPDIGDNTDWDSHQSSATHNTLIFTTPFNNRLKIMNPSPMYSHNFKISQNFLQSTLSFDFLFYDSSQARIFDIFNLFPNFIQRLQTLQITLMLYDEIDPIVEASKDAIKGQNIMRSMLPQFKRI